MAKKDDQMTDRENDSPSDLKLGTEPPPKLANSSDIASGSASPRAARFGEGSEGAPVRRERGLTGSRDNFFDRTGTFIRDVRSEMKRVSWPTATEVKNTTIITVIAVIFFAIYLWVIDRGFTFLVQQLEIFANWLFGG